MPLSMGLRSIFLLFSLFFVTQTDKCEINNIEGEIKSLIEKYGAVGISVAVVKNEQIVYVRSYGLKNREDSLTLHPNDLFRIASVSKTFVATAIMQLVEKGMLSLDDDVNKFLDFKIQNPKYPERTITIEMLLCHRSSINDSLGSKSFDKINPKTNPNFERCYNNYEPGKRFFYCNLNYGLLGAIIEKVTKLRFDRYISERIMKPLELIGSFNCLDLDSTLFVNSYRYKKDSFLLSRDTYLSHKNEINHYKLGYSTPALSPAGGMKITVSELAHYMMMHMNNGTYKKKRIISDRSEHLMRHIPLKSSYSLSISHYKDLIPNEELLGQTGGAYGIHTAMVFHPKKKYGFIVFCNGCKSSKRDGHDLNFEIIRLLYKNIVC